jgi:putative phosphoesterase
MRIAVISDLHGNLEAVEEVWDSFHDIDRIICLGDLVGIGPDPLEVLERVVDDSRIIRVMGNHDVNTRDRTELGPLQHVPRKPHHDWVREMLGDSSEELTAPLSSRLVLGSKEITFMHRHPDDCGSKVPYFDRPFPEVIDDFYADVSGDILLFGHTHIPLMLVGDHGRIYINPGSIGAENGGIATYAVLDDENGRSPGITLRKIKYDIERVRRKIERRKVPYWQFILKNFFTRGFSPSSTVNDI